MTVDTGVHFFSVSVFRRSDYLQMHLRYIHHLELDVQHRRRPFSPLRSEEGSHKRYTYDLNTLILKNTRS